MSSFASLFRGWFRPKPPTPTPPPTPTSRTIEVIVRNERDENVEGATVTIHNVPVPYVAVTTAGGIATFPSVSASLQNTQLTVEAPGYITFSQSIVLTANINQQVWLGGTPDQSTALRLPALERENGVVLVWPRKSASYYTSLTDPRIDPAEFAAQLHDLGCNGTRVWLIDAWAVGQGTGCYDGYHPWVRNNDGWWNLNAVSQPYLDRLRNYVEQMNSYGILPQLTGWELYSWSDRKQGLLWVPNAALGPFRHNRQGIVYGKDTAFRVIATGGPHQFLAAFYQRVVDTLMGLSYEIELGNEMPEKELHYRLRDAWRTAGYLGRIGVNRNDDTPGQYHNMKIGVEFDGISYHGKSHIEYLDEVYPDEPIYSTFREFYTAPPVPSHITLSSDGCRKSTDVEDAYDYPMLEAVGRDALSRGFGFEHQLALKLRGFTAGYVSLDDIKYDAPLLRSLYPQLI